MNTGIAFARKMSAAYTAVCKPLCQSLHLPQTAFDILMFLGNNPEYSTARDIVEVRQIKANLVSVNVDRLVKDGYLSRKEVAGDRRKTQLLCTQKAAPVIKKGQALQQDFADRRKFIFKRTQHVKYNKYGRTEELYECESCDSGVYDSGGF